MGDHSYHDWSVFGCEEHCPALYINLVKPIDGEPFYTDLLAAVDTGAGLTTVPRRCREGANIVPSRKINLQWRDYVEEAPVCITTVSINGYKPITIEVAYSINLNEYALIGRNLIKKWYIILKGPELVFSINEI